MKRFLLATVASLLLLNACAPGAPANKLPGLPFVVTITSDRQPATLPQKTPGQVVVTEQPVLPSLEATATRPATQTIKPTLTPVLPTPTHAATHAVTPTFTPVLPTPTETLLPPLELPTERSNPPARLTWTGLPTYPGDSDPGLLFRVDYDPDLWAQTESDFGVIVLGNRQIEYCTITPWTGRGLPVDWKVTHEFRYIGSAAFDVNTVTYLGAVKFVSYVGGDQLVLTGFRVSFNAQQDQCLQQAEAIFGTLRSFAAMPTATMAAPAQPVPATPTP